MIDCEHSLCSTSPAVTTKEEEAVIYPGADHSNEFVEPQDPFPGSGNSRDDVIVRDQRKAKAPAAQPQGQTVGPFLLTQESEAFREDVSNSFVFLFFYLFVRCAFSAPDRSSPRVYVQLVELCVDSKAFFFCVFASFGCAISAPDRSSPRVCAQLVELCMDSSVCQC